MKFSKGPWVVEYAADGSPYIEAPDGSVCSMGPYSGDRQGWVPEDDDEANARLIAAAPAMLAMLERVREEAFQCGTYESLREDLDVMLDRIKDRVDLSRQNRKGN